MWADDKQRYLEFKLKISARLNFKRENDVTLAVMCVEHEN
jgi:hypothetical protein